MGVIWFARFSEENWLAKKLILKDSVRKVQFLFIGFKVTKKEHGTLRSMLLFFEGEVKGDCVFRKNLRYILRNAGIYLQKVCLQTSCIQKVCLQIFHEKKHILLLENFSKIYLQFLRFNFHSF